MPNGYWTKENIQKEADKYSTRGKFAAGNLAAYKAAGKKEEGFLDKVCSHMDPPLTAAYSDEELFLEAKKYTKRGDFRDKSHKEYDASCSRGKDFLDKVCVHMEPPLTEAYSDEELFEKAKNYNKRSDFAEKDHGAYTAARNRGVEFFDRVCINMEEPLTHSYSTEELYAKAKLYNRRTDFEEGDGGAYVTACKHPEYELMCSHMDSSLTEEYTFEEVRDIALQYDNYFEFRKNKNGACKAAKRMGVLDQIRSHMIQLHGTSIAEKTIFLAIVTLYPTAKKIKDMTVCIPHKPYIRGFDIDVYVPELNRGIEFDGIYHHSFKYMRKTHNKRFWSDEDIRNYHELKDSWFASQGIQILHIKEEDWDMDKEACIQSCLDFLSK